jgi:glycosyltransferase involved in cell wall biosynthesis
MQLANNESVSFAVPEKLRDKKVLVMSESLGPINGVTRATQYLLDYLIKNGVRTAAVAPLFQTPDIATRLEIPVVRLGGYPLLYNPDLRIAYPFRMSKIFYRTFRPDVIYLASPATVGVQAWWQLRKASVPIVANFQTDLAHYSRTMLPGLVAEPVGKVVDRLTAWFYRDAAVKIALVPSSASRNYLTGLGIQAAKMRMVGRGVDCIQFDAAKRSAKIRAELAPNGEILLLCVSRVSYEKGFDFLAEAFAEITRRAQERGLFQKIRLVITGGNSNAAIMRDIQSYFSRRNLDVVFTGARTGEFLAQTFASADIFVYPSLTETFGQVVQEAMASGLPVVARREGGPADIVQPGETGYLPDPQNVAEFAQNVLTLVEDSTLRQRMSQNARAYALARTWDAVNYQIADLLVDAMQN